MFRAMRPVCVPPPDMKESINAWFMGACFLANSTKRVQTVASYEDAVS